MTLFDQISEDIKSAMKARDKVRLETLRNIKKVFLEAKTAPGANDLQRPTLKQGVKTWLMQSWHRWRYLRVICRNNFPKRR